MKLFLTSYIAGTEKQLKDFLKDYDSRILFIPTAGNVEEYTEYIDEGIKTLENLVNWQPFFRQPIYIFYNP